MRGWGVKLLLVAEKEFTALFLLESFISAEYWSVEQVLLPVRDDLQDIDIPAYPFVLILSEIYRFAKIHTETELIAKRLEILPAMRIPC